MTKTTDTAAAIVAAVGGASNIVHLSHCATRLRFELADASGISQEEVEAIDGVLGAVPQGGDRYQVIIGGAVGTVFNEINALPEMSGGGLSDADVKAAARAKARGKSALVDSFFEFLSDSFRPILGALLGASLIITFMALMGSLGVIGNWADSRVVLPPTWQFVNLMWQSVFYFLPLMVAYNATKKLGADPWVGFACMAVLLLPGFAGLTNSPAAETIKVFGSEVKVLELFGFLPLSLRDYGSQVFPPLLMAAVLAPLYKGLKRIITPNLQLIFVPFLTMLIMIPLTAFLIGPLGIYAGAGIAAVLKSINGVSALIFAIVVPLAYPFMVPLGLHWPINAIMLLNIKELGYDFIQGPMGAWNFACFGATAGVLFLAARDKDTQMRQTATGALAAGLLGGISEPSLYGIHLRYKRIYPRMLVGCVVGGLIIGLGGGVHTKGFVFTSLLTIPAFDNIPLYAAGIASAFVVAMVLVIVSDYRTPEQRAEVLARRAAADAAGTDSPAAAPAAAATGTARPKPPAQQPGAVTMVAAPVAGRLLAMSDVPDPVFASGAVGPGVGIEPEGQIVVTAPAPGKVAMVQKSGHAIGLLLDSGIELLIHVGLDTVNMDGAGFTVHVKQGQYVDTGQVLIEADREAILAAGYSLVTPVLVTNAKKFGAVTVTAEGSVSAGADLLQVEAKSA
ncbi:glucose PTS transporter subunit IIA [Buchananella hordeovulneris]|uniref:PTS beta-glucoside transporter subunit EIIBCA n=1 Tax=Buchananella hordeovulneris TaxID=52770 RepID=A0A1Q5PXF3_9ACTO|nr:glucose PTS transporter subunit IIA [Buchananella hordeovulneris]MDO5081433.1 glucose PTS transporter subunit IIA [Buchananella hordeovulneris]OKL52281.1 PTS beta-glucoside transporter subunit EIIBCA [Buchananella hordeovulneris]RRD45527.1 PTS beta-glucoside transporter subunit EIIBCA [Buchananella hordeovulneris]RRD52343.1 PTS beta-glucoside transporter subunit EIIBCA [Buchananella hordeovulneris]